MKIKPEVEICGNPIYCGNVEDDNDDCEYEIWYGGNGRKRCYLFNVLLKKDNKTGLSEKCSECLKAIEK